MPDELQSDDEYELIDFGDGRKLERFGAEILDRASPAAEGFSRNDPALWKSATLRFRRTSGEQGTWSPDRPTTSNWTFQHGATVFELKLTPFGHIGIFPEQIQNWNWIANRVKRSSRPLRVLNLFGYTGGSTLAAAAVGAEVTHVDAAKNVVAWARRNAELSGLSNAPIRWIVEDATKFVSRELRRNKSYDAVILDPPSYGHGPAGESWKIDRDLLPLLQMCGELTAQHREFVLLTCHSPGFGPAEIQATLADAVFGHCQSGAAATPLAIRSVDGRKLPAGVVARWPN